MEILHVTDELGHIIQKLPELLLASVNFLLERLQFILRSQDGRNIIDVVGAVNLNMLHLRLHLLLRSVCSLSFSYRSACSRDLLLLSSHLLLSPPLFYNGFYRDSDSNIERVRVKIRRRKNWLPVRSLEVINGLPGIVKTLPVRGASAFQNQQTVVRQPNLKHRGDYHPACGQFNNKNNTKIQTNKERLAQSSSVLMFK